MEKPAGQIEGNEVETGGQIAGQGWRRHRGRTCLDDRIDAGGCSVQAYSRRATMEMEPWRDWSLEGRRSVSGGWWWLAERETVRP